MLMMFVRPELEHVEPKARIRKTKEGQRELHTRDRVL